MQIVFVHAKFAEEQEEGRQGDCVGVVLETQESDTDSTLISFYFNALIKREICRRVDLSGRKLSCEPSKTDCCSRLLESRLAQTLVTILAAVFMRQIGRIDSKIFSSPTFFGISVVSDGWSLSHLGYLYPGTTAVMIKLDHNRSCPWV